MAGAAGTGGRHPGLLCQHPLRRGQEQDTGEDCDDDDDNYDNYDNDDDMMFQGPQPVPGSVKYRGTLAAIATVYREEG